MLVLSLNSNLNFGSHRNSNFGSRNSLQSLRRIRFLNVYNPGRRGFAGGKERVSARGLMKGRGSGWGGEGCVGVLSDIFVNGWRWVEQDAGWVVYVHVEVVFEGSV